MIVVRAERWTISMNLKPAYCMSRFEGYLGNVGLRLAVKNYTTQRRLWLPSVLRPKLGARRFGLFGLFIVFILSGPFLAQAQQAEPAPAVTVQELEDLAAVMEDKAAREQLLSRIRALIATRKNTQVEPPVASAGARMIAALSENVRETSRQLVAAALPARGAFRTRRTPRSAFDSAMASVPSVDASEATITCTLPGYARSSVASSLRARSRSPLWTAMITEIGGNASPERTDRGESRASSHRINGYPA